MKRALAIFLGSALITTASADEPPVYESLSTLSIGRVFYSQPERELLDLRRDHPQAPVAISGKTGGRKSASRDHKDAAGYIISSSGHSRVWKKGDFVTSSRSQVDQVAFPGEVAVKRHDEAGENED